MDKIVVTGGAGFIGHHLVGDHVKEGHEVMVLDNYAGGQEGRPRPSRTVKGADYRNVDITTHPNLAGLFAGADLVFHLAALPRVQDSIDRPAVTQRVNEGGTLAVLEAARKAKVGRVVFASSSAVYGEPTQLPINEQAPLNPMSPYAKQKRASEEHCLRYTKEHGLETVCLRLFNVYGPGADPEGAYALVVARFIALRLAGEPLTITGDGTQTRDFVHVSDVAQAFWRAATHWRVGHAEVINIGGGRQISVNEVADAIGGPKVYGERRDEPHDSLADIRLAKKLLGWEPTIPFEEGIKDLRIRQQILT
jgi:UDP-glucose 4-epimerase